MFSDINENEKRNYLKKPGDLRYTEKLKRFALTLHYLSLRTYGYYRLACITDTNDPILFHTFS